MTGCEKGITYSKDTKMTEDGSTGFDKPAKTSEQLFCIRVGIGSTETKKSGYTDEDFDLGGEDEDGTNGDDKDKTNKVP